MTTGQHENNQDIFDDYVRHAVKEMGIDYIEESPDRILQTMEEGDFDLERAFHAVAIAQAAFLMTAVYTPYDEPEWVQEAWKLRGRFAKLAEPLLNYMVNIALNSRQHPGDPQRDIERFFSSQAKEYISLQRRRTLLNTVLTMMQSPQWLWESSELTRIIEDESGIQKARDSIILQDVDFALRRAEFFSNEEEVELFYSYFNEEDGVFYEYSMKYYEPEFFADYTDFLVEYVKSRDPLDIVSFEWRSPTKWHRRYAAFIITGHVDTSNRFSLSVYKWGALLDTCMWLIRELPSCLPDSNPFSEKYLLGDLKRHSEFTPDCSEYWAWEFGRLVATWPDRVEDDEEDAEFKFRGYESYSAAFSIMADDDSSTMPGNPDPITISALVALTRQYPAPEDADFRAVDFAPGNVAHLSHWIAKLGYRYARNSRETATTTPALSLAVSAPVNVTPSHLGIEPSSLNTIDPEHIGQLANALDQLIRQERSRRAREIEYELERELTGELWDHLSDDAKDYLLQAEGIRREEESPRKAALDYARAVECVLEDWLPAPRGQRVWPGNDIGQWCDVLRKMSRPEKERRHRLDPVVRQNFEAQYAAALWESLDVLRRLRRRDAHSDDAPSRPHQVSDIVLGTEDRPSIFELILRFAKKWPPSE